MNLRIPTLLLALASGPRLAQGQQTNVLVLTARAHPSLDSVTMGPVVRAWTRRIGLVPLSQRVRGTSSELWVWDGFGITGTALTVFRQNGLTWHRQRYELTSQGDARSSFVDPDSLDATRRMTSAFGLGLLRLPSRPVRPRTNMVVSDGWSVIVEGFIGDRYFALGADNPNVFCSPNDRELFRVATALLTSTEEPCR